MRSALARKQVALPFARASAMRTRAQSRSRARERAVSTRPIGGLGELHDPGTGQLARACNGDQTPSPGYAREEGASTS